MNRKVILFIATSLDGYIATEEDSLDWLFKIEGEGDNGYSEFLETIDTIIMGRRTYDWILKEVPGDFPYQTQKCYVFTNTLKESNANIEFVSEEASSLLSKIKKTPGKNIWIVGGGELISHFIKEKLIDEYILTVAPVLIGKGIPLFKKMEGEVELELLGTRQFNQFVELHYKMKNIPMDL